MVAEKSTFYVFLLPVSVLMNSNIFFMSSTKPKLSISSASSKTTVLMSDNYNLPLLYKSMILPGVPITTSVPSLNFYIYIYISSPPYTKVTLNSPLS